ncbi:1-phosphofructokinase family hexose kinase [Microbacterium album]|uniref:1-phosphofructokinase n=1 Tax=Microbacterium album TaxID=2053191 RepID=A0A917MM63_9MICO|nr:PfkB family carbohydrate kinase [Microbacterium album]GGH46504.1 1-phosphofructokinase [Microbacterium album]
MDATIFAPSPTLTVTIEDHESGPDIHVHAGGQGVWQARMLRRLGVDVTMCCVLTGETGLVVRNLLTDEGFRVIAVERAGRGAAYVHDRRDGARAAIAETQGDRLGRHELDELYGATLREGIDSRLVLLSGPDGDGVLPHDTYRRLAADLRGNGARVVVDLAGERMTAALEGGVDLLKVSDEELRADGLLPEDADEDDTGPIIAAMEQLRERGAGDVIVTRGGEPFLVLDGDRVLEVTQPQLQAAETRGAGDSLTGGVCAGLAAGERLRDAIVTGAAAGALNVTRHGLGTGDAETIRRLRDGVRVRVLRGEDVDGDRPAAEDDSRGRVSPDGLASLAQPGEETEEVRGHREEGA